MSIWPEIAMAVGYWTFIAIPTACVLSFLFCKLDRHPKDGPRCRKCDFDLRASTGESCTECGAPFKPRGVWPTGKPSRKQLAVVISIWSWLVVSFAIGIQYFYVDYEFDFAQYGYVDTHCISLFTPKSDAFNEVAIFDSGTEFRLLIDQFGFSDIEADQIVIWLETKEGELIVCAVELETGKVARPEGPTADQMLSSAKYFSTNNEHCEPIDYLLSALKAENAPIINEAAVRAELAFLIKLAEEISVGKADAAHWDDIEVLTQPILDTSGLQSYFEFAEFTGWSEYYYFPALPVWAVYVPPIISLAVWGIGVFVLRLILYRRQAADAVPAST